MKGDYEKTVSAIYLLVTHLNGQGLGHKETYRQVGKLLAVSRKKKV